MKNTKFIIDLLCCLRRFHLTSTVCVSLSLTCVHLAMAFFRGGLWGGSGLLLLV